MKLGVRPTDFNDYSVEFDGSDLSPPLIVPSLKGLCSLTDF